MKKVLIADDSMLTRMMLKTIISAKHPDWSITEAVNGREAVTKAESGGFDIITLDMNMPELDGLAAAPAIRRSNPRARIALITANVQDAVRAKARVLGLEFINKPIEENKIEAFLASAI
jgi:CheY-like chemotaxis protein